MIAEDVRARALARFTEQHGTDPYLLDPVGWVKDKRGAWVTDQQSWVCNSVRDNRRTAVHSANGLGKSFTVGSLAVWWIMAHPIGDPDNDSLVVSTSESNTQLSGVLWKNIRDAHTSAQAPGKIDVRQWKINDRIVAIGVKPADTNPTGAQGWHATNVLVIIDEACGVPKDLFDAMEGAIPKNESDNHRIIAIGNPTDSTSYFAQICQPGSGWNVIRLDAFDSPNFTDEKNRTPKKVRDALPGPEWAEEKKLQWGETSPVYLARVRGMFPEDDPTGVVRPSMVAKCQRGLEYLPSDKRLAPVELGLDVGGGGDKSVCVVRYGMRPELAWEDTNRDSEIVVGKAIATIKETHATSIKVDHGGIGHGVCGHLRQMIREDPDITWSCAVVEVNFGATPNDPKRFPMARDEMWWDIGRQMTEDQAWDLSLIGDQALADLQAPKWAPDARARIRVEQKVDTKKRIGHSPDHADALLLAYYTPRGSLTSYLEALKQERDNTPSLPPMNSAEPSELERYLAALQAQ